MTDEIDLAPRRGRPPKDAPPKDRRRKGSTGGFKQHLAVDKSQLDTVNFDYRWINDDEMRLHSLTKEDNWDLVADPSKSVKEDGTDMGSAISKVVGRHQSGEPKRAYLARKHKQFSERDMQEKREAVDRVMHRIMGAGDDSQRASVPNSYGDGIRIEEGSRR